MAMDWQSEGLTTQPAPLEVIDPQPGHPHKYTAIFLHGRGDRAPDFARGIRYMTWSNSSRQTAVAALPTFRWVFPNAGQKPCARPGESSMNQWFDVWDHLNFADHEDLQLPGLQESTDRIRKLIADEAARLGGRYDRIVLMGISQGGATSVHALLNLGLPEAYSGPKRLGAFVGVATRFPFPGRSLNDTRQLLGLEGTPRDDELLLNTPVLLQHCVDDPTVLFPGGKQLREQLEGYGVSVTWKEWPEGGHWFKSPEGLDDLIEFFSKVLPKD